MRYADSWHHILCDRAAIRTLEDFVCEGVLLFFQHIFPQLSSCLRFAKQVGHSPSLSKFADSNAIRA